MTDEPWPTPPDDEPIIGGSIPPPPARPQAPVFGGAAPVAYGQWDDAGVTYDDGTDEAPIADEYADDEYGWDGEAYDDPYAYGYDDRPPARQPMFYVFLGLAALVGVAAIFLLVTIARSGGSDDNGGPTTTANAAFDVAIDAPRTGDRFDVGKPVDINVRATSNEDVARFELFINDRSVGQVDAGSADAQHVYAASFKTQFDRRGEYSIYVRVSSALGASKNSEKVRVTAVEDIGTKPAEVKGRVITSTTMRNGPGENFQSAGTISPPAEVVVLGKNADASWLFIDTEGGHWVRAVALDVPEIALVPLRDASPSPTPQITATVQVQPTATPTSQPSATATPTSSPDFVPTNAVLLSGGSRLRVTVSNIGPAPFSGALAVSISGDPGSEARAFNVTLPANNGRADVEFDLATPITAQGKTVRVAVNPDKSPREANFDNNSATFTLAVSVEPPSLSITARLTQAGIDVTITNSGGALAADEAKISVRLGTEVVSRTANLNLAKGASTTVTLSRPSGAGEATIDVRTKTDQPLASGTLTIAP